MRFDKEDTSVGCSVGRPKSVHFVVSACSFGVMVLHRFKFPGYISRLGQTIGASFMTPAEVACCLVKGCAKAGVIHHAPPTVPKQ